MTNTEYEQAYVQMAKFFAMRKHRDQKRKYNGAPYFTHPQRVAEEALRRGFPYYAVAAMYLHDVVEDCEVSLRRIEYIFPDEEFGKKVARIVKGMTNTSKKSGKPRVERKKMDHKRLSKESPEVKKCKMLDRIDNLREMQGADTNFREIYANESLSLAFSVGDADEDLRKELMKAIDDLLQGKDVNHVHG